MSNRIPLSECVHGGLYRIHARNFSLGVFNEKQQGFVGIRTKFDHRYLFTEYHYDTGAPFGTVSPKELLEQCPLEDVSESQKGEEHWEENKALRSYMEDKLKQYGTVDGID